MSNLKKSKGYIHTHSHRHPPTQALRLYYSSQNAWTANAAPVYQSSRLPLLLVQAAPLQLLQLSFERENSLPRGGGGGGGSEG